MRSLPFKAVWLVIVCALSPLLQSQAPASSDASERPLPDVPALMHEVQQHQRAAEAAQKDYIFHEVVTRQEESGKTERREYDVFWLNGVKVHKMTRKDGRDLTTEELKKEDERIDKEVEKARERRSKADARGNETDSQGYEEVTVSRFLALGSFTNPRRVQLDGRDTIAVDYIGDPKAKTHNRSEDFVKNLAGTVWVDEQDHTIARLEGRFANSFKIGAGLVMNIRRDTTFSFRQRKINDEVWLPEGGEGRGAARVLLFVSFNGTIHFTCSDYRKFKATSKILPGVATINEASPDGEASQSGVPTPPR